MQQLRPVTRSAVRRFSWRISAAGCAARNSSIFRRFRNPSRRCTMTKRIYAGAGHYATKGKHFQGGLFRTEPGHRDWKPLTRGLPEQVEARAFAVNPRDSQVIYVGTQDGPYRSLNGGDSWERTN